ncbi:MAG: hypothetical protein AVDCRST_MAG36-50, partial [uncultured Nocardioidaceae bacterium]
GALEPGGAPHGVGVLRSRWRVEPLRRRGRHAGHPAGRPDGGRGDRRRSRPHL